MNEQRMMSPKEHAEAAKEISLILAEQCTRHLKEDDELTESEIMEMYYDQLLWETAHDTYFPIQ